MKTLVVFDSCFGNTEKLARAMAEVSGAECLIAKDFNNEKINDVDLLVIGSPTQAGRPLPTISNLIDNLPNTLMCKIAIFDTRSQLKWVKIFGFASDRGAKKILSKKLDLAVKPEAFFVKDKEGPLVDGEVERAKEWIKKIIN